MVHHDKNGCFIYEFQLLEHKCLICGGDMPTKTRTERRNGKDYCSDYTHTVKSYDRATDNHFLRMENPKLLNEVHLRDVELTKERERAGLQEKLAAIRQDVENTVPKQYQPPLMEGFTREGKNELTLEVPKPLKGFIEWFGKPFEEKRSFSDLPNYSVHGTCIAPELQEAERQKYVVDGDATRILRARLEMPYDQFAGTFRYLINENHLPVTGEGTVSLEVRHFSEF